MISNIKSVKSKFTPFLLAILFFAVQIASTVAISLVNTSSASAAPLCSSDSAGANDEPGQKDLTRMCIDSTTGQISWNWDELSVNGANTLDGCALFDTDGDGFVNRSLCISTTDGVTFTKLIYVCSADNRVDRCAGADTGSVATSTCSLAVTATQPFGAGANSPNDLTATCTPTIADAGGGVLMDVCSYPSGQPNSDPSDCVMYRDNSARIEVRKVVEPNTDPGLFNLRIGSTTYATNVGNGGTTGEVILTSGSITVSEIAGINTNLANYTTTVSCRDANGTGTVIGSGSPTGTTSRQLTFTAADASDIVCIFTNTRQAGTIQVIKNVDSDGDGVVDQSGVSDWNWNINGSGNYATGSTQSVNVGSYTISEVQKSGYHVTASSCTGETIPTSPTTSLTVNVATGENVVCTFTNTRDTGFITVNKSLVPNTDTGKFNLQIDGSTAGTGSEVGHNGTTGQVRVPTGVHTVSEIAGTDTNLDKYSSSYTCMSNQQQVASGNGTSIPSLNVVKDSSIICTFTNTKYATLNIIKDAVPNAPGLFGFLATGNGVGGFTLDDDPATTNVSNQKTYDQLLPGTYTVAELEATGWALSSVNCDLTSTGIDRGLSITLTAGQQATCTFVNTKYGSITGQKFEDLNGNSAWDEGEPVLSGWKIYIELDGLPGYTAGDIAYDTDEDGIYLFENLLPDTYSIFEHFSQTQIDEGWVQTLAPQSIYLEAGENVDENTDFGNFLNGTITGFKFNDKNGNTKQDEGDNKMSGWEFVLLGDGDDADTDLDDQIQVAETNADGNYIFTNVPKGIYQVCEIQKAGWVQTIPLNNGCYLIEINQSGQEITNLYFGNQGRGTITVVKEVYPYNDPQDFNFTISPYEEEEECYDDVSLLEVSECYEAFDYVSNVAEFTLDDDHDETLSNTEETEVIPGQYLVSEEATEGWDLANSYCVDNSQENEYEGISRSNGHIVSVYPGSDITCYFTNVKRGTVTIVKDARPNSDQEFTFTHNIEDKYSEDFTLVDDGENVETASTTFTNVRPGYYGITELDVENWRQADFSCDNERDEDDEEFIDQRQLQKSEDIVDEEWFENYIYVRPGEDVTCTFVNEATVINLEKSNNKPNPTVVDDEVVYTLKVQIPSEAGTVFDAVVIDLPPENFEYVPGSWTANSNVRGDLKATSVTTEPTYASPGTWLLGNVVGGEQITLTYVARILSIVTPGTYPDIAFVTGLDFDEQEVLGNVTTSDTPFVGTTVAVMNPVVGKIFTAPLLANTGRSLTLLNVIIPVLLIGLTLLAYRRSRQYPEKGGQL